MALPPEPNATPTPPVAPTPEPAPAATPAPTPAPPVSDPSAQTPPETDWKAEARKWEERAKENRTAAEKLKEIEDAQKTAEQKAAEALAEAQGTANDSKSELLKLNAALSKAPVGTDPAVIRDLAGRLRGSTPEELEADAAQLFGRIGVTPSAATAVGQPPVENLLPGGPQTPTPEQPLPIQIAAAEAAGETEKAMALKSRLLYETMNPK